MSVGQCPECGQEAAAVLVSGIVRHRAGDKCRQDRSRRGAVSVSDSLLVPCGSFATEESPGSCELDLASLLRAQKLLSSIPHTSRVLCKTIDYRTTDVGSCEFRPRCFAMAWTWREPWILPGPRISKQSWRQGLVGRGVLRREFKLDSIPRRIANCQGEVDR